MLNLPMFRPSRLMAAWLIPLGLFSGLLSSTARAQFNGDPFDPYRAAYRSSSLPSNSRFLPGRGQPVTSPGMGTVPGIGQPFDSTFGPSRVVAPAEGRFDRLEEELFGPLGNVYRRYDSDFGRQPYEPAAEANEAFTQAQDERRAKYLEAMNERDPQKRAELLQEYRLLSRRISLGLSPSASRAALNADAEGSDLSNIRRGASLGPSGLPTTVRSFDDLLLWSRHVNREALRVGVVRPEAE